MKILFDEDAWKDYLYWEKHDRDMLDRINVLIREIQRDPFTGIGKPEPLRYGLSGYWSRRITSVHRIVYKVQGDALCIAQLRYHT
mgnify:FL=1|jgi:toxin YoeB